MTAAPRWVRVGGGMESIPDRRRHGPADVEFPPPGGPWEALSLNGRLVGWAEEGGLRVARRSAELGEQLVAEPVGAWWRVRIETSEPRRPLAVPEMGEPLLRLIVDTHLDGWLDSSARQSVDIYLPAHRYLPARGEGGAPRRMGTPEP